MNLDPANPSEAGKLVHHPFPAAVVYSITYCTMSVFGFTGKEQFEESTFLKGEKIVKGWRELQYADCSHLGLDSACVYYDDQEY